MKKTIKIMAIIATGLTALSMTLLVISTLFQGAIARGLSSVPQEVMGMFPLFPWVEFISSLIATGCVGLLIVCCVKEKQGIGMEILIVLLLALVLPIINSAASSIYSVVLGRYGSARIAAHSYVSQIAAFCLYPSNWGRALAYVACGMNIAYKTISKKHNIEQ